MHMQSDVFSDVWLEPIIELVQSNDFAEAFALAEYYPSTPGRQLIQCAALLAQDKVDDAGEILGSLFVDKREISRDFARLLENSDVDFLGIANDTRTYYFPKGIEESLYLRYLCIESHCTFR